VNWIFRLDRNRGGEASLDFEHSVGRIVEFTRRRWRIGVNDYLVFVRGHSLAMSFEAVGRVSGVRAPDERSARGGEYPYEVNLSELHRVTPVQLEQMMYSLTKVANLTRPSLHFRHRGAIGDLDLKRLLTGEISVGRSMYYGLLRHIAPEWRDRFEAHARLRSLSRRTDRVDNEGEEAFPPVAELYDVVEEAIVTPMRLGREVGRRWSEVFPDEGVVRVEDDRGGSWAMLRFCQEAERVARFGDAWSELYSSAQAAHPTEQDRAAQWRRHYW
jgi:hypothetical protein